MTGDRNGGGWGLMKGQIRGRREGVVRAAVILSFNYCVSEIYETKVPLTRKPHLPEETTSWTAGGFGSSRVTSHVCKQGWLPQRHRMCLTTHRWEVYRQKISQDVCLATLDEGRKHNAL